MTLSLIFLSFFLFWEGNEFINVKLCVCVCVCVCLVVYV
jgi:hypothetical protein